MDGLNRHTLLARLRTHHRGRAQGVSARELVREILGLFARPADERSLRLLVEELRREGVLICAHPASGYYLPADDQELSETLAFLNSRAMTSLIQIAQLKRQALPDLMGQMAADLRRGDAP